MKIKKERKAFHYETDRVKALVINGYIGTG